MDGARLRMGQLFDRESGRSFIVAFDHGTNREVVVHGVPVGR